MSVCCLLFIFCYGNRRKIQVTNRVHASEQTLKEVVELLKSERSSSLDYKAKFEEEHRQLDVVHEQNMLLQKRLDALLSTIESLREQLSLMNQHKYGSKSRSGNP